MKHTDFARIIKGVTTHIVTRVLNEFTAHSVNWTGSTKADMIEAFRSANEKAGEGWANRGGLREIDADDFKRRLDESIEWTRQREEEARKRLEEMQERHRRQAAEWTERKALLGIIAANIKDQPLPWPQAWRDEVLALISSEIDRKGD